MRVLLLLWCWMWMPYSVNPERPATRIRISTDQGDMVFRLSEATPLHRDNFLRRIDQGLWEGAQFNRIVKDFVVQGGCEDLSDGRIEADSWIPPEFSDSLTHRFGALGMGRDDNAAKYSADCQFYIVTHPNGLSRLDGEYTIIGQLIEGEEVLRLLNEWETDDNAPAIALRIERI